MRPVYVLIVVAFAVTCLVSDSLAVNLRLRGGLPIPVGKFRHEPSVLPCPPEDGTRSSAGREGEYSVGADVSISFPRFPLCLVVAVGYVLIDDVGNEFEEATYEYPLGTGRFTDYKHRFLPITVGVEYPFPIRPRLTTILGIAVGVYRHKFSSYSDYKPESERHHAVGEESYFGEHTLPGARLYLLESVRVAHRYGVFLGIECNLLAVDKDTAIGMHPAGYYHNLVFYRVELGVAVGLSD